VKYRPSGNLSVLVMCHDEDEWCQIPINSFLLEAYDKLPECCGQWRQRECW